MMEVSVIAAGDAGVDRPAPPLANHHDQAVLHARVPPRSRRLAASAVAHHRGPALRRAGAAGGHHAAAERRGPAPGRWFKGYAAGLYLTRKVTTADQALSAPGPKRLQIRMLVDVDTVEFSKSFNRGVRRNSSPAQQAALGERMQAFDKLILGVGKVKTNDAVDIDFLPGRGVVLSVNGKPRGEPIPGDDLYAALLRIFLGDKPADPELKQGLLGAPALKRRLGRPMDARTASQALIDRFVDALWLEDGLAPNTLAAYRRDLSAVPTGSRATPAAHSTPAARATCSATSPRATPARGHQRQPPAHGVQALSSAWRCASGWSQADPTLQLLAAPPADARAQDAERGAGRGAAGGARRRHAARPARPRHARADVRERPARERAGHAQEHSREPERRRAARHRQGQRRSAWCRSARRRTPGSSATWPKRGPRCSARGPATICSSPRAARA